MKLKILIQLRGSNSISQDNSCFVLSFSVSNGNLHENFPISLSQSSRNVWYTLGNQGVTRGTGIVEKPGYHFLGLTSGNFFNELTKFLRPKKVDSHVAICFPFLLRKSNTIYLESIKQSYMLHNGRETLEKDLPSPPLMKSSVYPWYS